MLFKRSSFARVAGALGLSLALAVGGTAYADDYDDPKAYLYEGTCAEFADARVVDDIDDLEDDDLNEIWAYIGNGQDMPDGLLGEEDDVDDVGNDVQVLVDGDYAVVVHEFESTRSDVLVCGDIKGEVVDGTILIELDEVDASGWEGRAFIHPDDDDDDDELEFVVGIYPAGSVDPLPAATPAS